MTSEITFTTNTERPDSNEYDIICEKCEEILISWKNRITLRCSLVCPCGHTMEFGFTPEININATISTPAHIKQQDIDRRGE